MRQVSAFGCSEFRVADHAIRRRVCRQEKARGHEPRAFSVHVCKGGYMVEGSQVTSQGKAISRMILTTDEAKKGQQPL